jgi:hypothetical protein
MGYELEMRVGRLNKIKMEKGNLFFEDCVIDLCSCGESSVSKLAENFMIRSGDGVLSWYEGNRKRTTDSYGHKPTPIKIKQVIDALRKDVKVLDHGDNDRPYRRFEWALSLLESIEKRDNGREKEFCVIFLGH